MGEVHSSAPVAALSLKRVGEYVSATQTYGPSSVGVIRTALPKLTDQTVLPVPASKALNQPPSLPA